MSALLVHVDQIRHLDAVPVGARLSETSAATSADGMILVVNRDPAVVVALPARPQRYTQLDAVLVERQDELCPGSQAETFLNDVDEFDEAHLATTSATTNIQRHERLEDHVVKHGGVRLVDGVAFGVFAFGVVDVPLMAVEAAEVVATQDATRCFIPGWQLTQAAAEETRVGAVAKTVSAVEHVHRAALLQATTTPAKVPARGRNL